MTEKNAGNPGGENTIDIDLDQVMLPVQKASEAVEKMIASARVDAVYGKPIKQDGYTIIPTAEILSAAGFGFGAGGGTSGRKGEQEEQDKGEADTDSGTGGGGGGGGRTFSRPVAVIIASADGVRVEPVIDKTKIGMTLLTTLGFMVATLMRIKKGMK